MERISGIGVFLVMLVLAALPVIDAMGHPPSIVSEAGSKAVQEEIKAFRKSLADAIAAKDAAKLRDMYAPSFIHTHTTAKTDNRDARVVSALAGEPVIETAQAEDLVIRIPNDWVAVATGISPIKSSTDGSVVSVRWTAVYTRTEKSWHLVASHATRVPEAKP